MRKEAQPIIKNGDEIYHANETDLKKKHGKKFSLFNTTQKERQFQIW